MKTKLISTLKKELLIIELPEETYYEVFKHGILFKDHLESEREFIEGTYTLLGSPDEIKEDDAKELVNLHESGYYKDYINGNNFFTLPSKSFISALVSEIYWDVNPMGEKPKFEYDFPEDGPSDSMYESAVDDFDLSSIKWNEAQQKTFDRNRTLIFVKN